MRDSSRQEYWRKHIRDWKSSGLSGPAYAERQGIQVSSLYSWSKSSAKSEVAGRLVSVEVIPKVGAFARLYLRPGCWIEFDESSISAAAALFQRVYSADSCGR